jgi:D-tyrosyl-tRNA(Tyr) deacylase
MRAVIQRVSRARVTHPKGAAEIGAGLLVLLGVGKGDDQAASVWLARKCLDLRLFEDDAGRMNRSVRELGGGILVVSQFTLYGDCRKGRRPSFDGAAPPEEAERLYEHFVDEVRGAGLPVGTGAFGEMMEVELVNHGPVTLVLDSPR